MSENPPSASLDALVADLHELYHPEGVYLWLTGKHRLLGRPALEEWFMGDPQKVLQIVNQLKSGAFA